MVLGGLPVAMDRVRIAPRPASEKEVSRPGIIREIYVITGWTQVAKNDRKEIVMATPAISDGLIVVRTRVACTASDSSRCRQLFSLRVTSKWKRCRTR